MVKRIFILLISSVVFNLTSYCCKNNYGGLLCDTLSTRIIKYIPDGYEIVSLVNGFLNSDSLPDYAVIIRKPNEMDSNLLLVLFQTPDNMFFKSLESNEIISVRYDNVLEIKNNILHIETDEPWHGTNSNLIDLTFRNSDWICLRIESFCDDSNNSWENSIDFVTGEFTINHGIYDKNDQTQIRKISGKLENIKPVSIITDNISKHLSIKYEGKDYYVSKRCNLWSDDEIYNLIGE